RHQGSSANLLFGVARYTVGGVLDPTFGSGGTVASVAGTPTGVVIQPDNKIIVVGNMLQPDGVTAAAAVVARFNVDGSLDTHFGTGGEIVTANNSARGVALQIDGKIIVVGFAFNSSSGISRPLIERYNPNGSPDAGFNTSTLGASPNGVVLQGDGRI